MAIKHVFNCALADVPADAASGKILPSHWNAGHSSGAATDNQPLLADGVGGFKFGTPLIVPTTPNILIGDNAGGITTGAGIISSASASALAVGPNGVTNPVLKVNASAASAATGLEIIAGAAGTTPILTASSPNSNESLRVASKGSANMEFGAGSFASCDFQVAGVNVMRQNANTLAMTPVAQTTNVTAKLTYRCPTETWFNANLTAGQEAPQWALDLTCPSARNHATGAIAIQRDIRITPCAHTFNAASTITTAATVGIGGPVIADAECTITTSVGLYVQSISVTSNLSGFRGTGTVTTGAGAMFDAPTNASTNLAVILNGASYVQNVSADPSATPSGGGFFYAKAGALYWKGSSGTVTLVAPA